jgi:hypothetical protein
MASPDAKAYPHSQPFIELTTPYYIIGVAGSIAGQIATVYCSRFGD